MKTIKRLTKLDCKSECQTSRPHERQGMYYQFLIERKVANGTLRHIASNEDVVTYQFIPNSYDSKRRKLGDGAESNSEHVITKEEEFKDYERCLGDSIAYNEVELSNLNAKSLEDKASHKARTRHAIAEIRNQIRSNLNLDYNKPCFHYKEPSPVSTNCLSATKLSMKKRVSSQDSQTKFTFLRNTKPVIPCNLKIRNQDCCQNEGPISAPAPRCSEPCCNAEAKYFITYASKNKVRISGPNGKTKECNMRKSKSMSEAPSKVKQRYFPIKRNPNIKYIRADVLTKHEKLRDEEFENKIFQLIGLNNCNQENRDSLKENRTSNIERFSLEVLDEHESLNDKTESDHFPKDANELIIAQNYGSYDEDELSKFSSMKDDSLSGDFDLEVVGNKIEAPKPFDPHDLEEDINKMNNVSQLGFKRTFGQPSGDVFGLTFDPECTGIFADGVEHEFLPVNTIEDNN